MCIGTFLCIPIVYLGGQGACFQVTLASKSPLTYTAKETGTYAC